MGRVGMKLNALTKLSSLLLEIIIPFCSCKCLIILHEWLFLWICVSNFFHVAWYNALLWKAFIGCQIFFVDILDTVNTKKKNIPNQKKWIAISLEFFSRVQVIMCFVDS